MIDWLLVLGVTQAAGVFVYPIWAIGTLFGCFKSRGFCLEATHLQDPERLSKLIALLTLALC